MTTIRNTAIAAIAAFTMAASMAAPANALSTGQKIGIGFGAAALIAGAAAHAHAHDNGYYDDDYGYRGGRAYRRAFRKCDNRYGEGTWRFDKCMARRGF
ncbi:MAG: hypothetical protein WBD37_16175 [Anderseniella sp.]